MKAFYKVSITSIVSTCVFVIYMTMFYNQGPGTLEYGKENLPRRVTCNPRDLVCLANLKAKLTEVAGSGKTLTLVVVDQPFLDMFFNFYRSASDVGISNILPVALNNATYQHLHQLGYHCYLEDETEDIGNDESDFKSEAFNKKGAMKFVITARLLQLNYSVLLCDVDLVFFRSPFYLFQCASCDFEIESANYKPGLISLGFCLFRPTAIMKEFLGTLNQRLKHGNLWDQGTFKDMLTSSEFPVRYRRIPFNLVPNGIIFNDYLQRHGHLPFNGPYLTYPGNVSRGIHVYHASAGGRTLFKMHRIRELGKWVLENTRYYTNSDAKYLQYWNPHPWMKAYDQTALSTAVKLCEKLNRILIMPRFYCPSPDIETLSPGCILTDLFRTLTDDETSAKLGTQWTRETTFLLHKLVPDSIKRSQSPRIFIYTNRTEHLLSSTSKETAYVFKSKAKTPGERFTEILQYLENYSNYSVLNFHSLYFDI